jgi:hypothetical protein
MYQNEVTKDFQMKMTKHFIVSLYFDTIGNSVRASREHMEVAHDFLWALRAEEQRIKIQLDEEASPRRCERKRDCEQRM